jgi:hypothetical protein
VRASPSTGGPRLGLRLGVALAVALAAAAGGAKVAAAEPSSSKAAVRGGSSPAPTGKANTEAQRRARRLFQDAEAHFQAGLFAEALGEYQAGYDAAALPGFLINIAQCQRRLGNLTGALTTYRKFIMVAPDSPYVPQVRSLVADLEKLAKDGERERERERAASAKPGARTTDGDGGRGGRKGEPKSTLPVDAGKAGPSLAAKPPVEPQAPALIGTPLTKEDGTEPEVETKPAPRASSTKWWWIGGAAALLAVAGGTATVFALRSGDTTTVHEGSLGSLRR